MDKPVIVDQVNNSDKVAAVIEDVIDAGERPFGATAWKGYREQGRGVVLVSFKNIPTSLDEIINELTSSTYRSLAAARSQGLGRLWGFDDKTIEIIEAYDPESEFVLSFFEPLEQHSTWRVRPVQAPPEAFRYLGPELFGPAAAASVASAAPDATAAAAPDVSFHRDPDESMDDYIRGLEAMVTRQPPSYDEYAMAILSAYLQLSASTIIDGLLFMMIERPFRSLSL